MLWFPQVLDKQKPGKREVARSCRYPMVESGNHDDPGWESEVRSREEELSKYEGSILAREFKERLAYNMGQVLPFALPCTVLCSTIPSPISLATRRSVLEAAVARSKVPECMALHPLAHAQCSCCHRGDYRERQQDQSASQVYNTVEP